MTTEATPDRRVNLVETLFHGTGEDYDYQVHLTTLGYDNKWKAEMLDILDGHKPKAILDLACGTGIFSFALLERYAEATLTGVELRDEYLVHARSRAADRGVEDRVEWILSRAEEAPLGDRMFDTVTTCYLPKYADLKKQIPLLADHMKPGALLLFQDFSYPEEKFRHIWHAHFERVQKMCRERYPHWITMFEKLPGVIQNSPWIEELAGLLEAGPFTNVKVHPQMRGISTLVMATRK